MSYGYSEEELTIFYEAAKSAYIKALSALEIESDPERIRIKRQDIEKLKNQMDGWRIKLDHKQGRPKKPRKGYAVFNKD